MKTEIPDQITIEVKVTNPNQIPFGNTDLGVGLAIAAVLIAIGTSIALCFWACGYVYCAG
jgi:hypothetical protein